MTPGFAKPRSELPWLPYGETDRVIINAHNFTPAWTPAVNGKMPVAAWVPSRDTAGNGTTTLTDLVGSKNGTLTNMDAATDWVADTDAGGVRALDFDGTDDFATLGSGIVLPSSGGLAISWWEKVGTGSGTYRSRFRFYTGTQAFFVFRSADGQYGRLAFARDGVSNSLRCSGVVPMASAAGIWVHFVISGTAGANNTTPANWSVFENGVSKTVDSGNLFSSQTANVNQIGWDGVLSGADCRMDDMRVWHQSLDSADAMDLYASGSGRGISA
jgi:hypothetical protein